MSTCFVAPMAPSTLEAPLEMISQCASTGTMRDLIQATHSGGDRWFSSGPSISIGSRTRLPLNGRSKPSQEGSTNTVGLDGGQPIVSAPCRPGEAELNVSSFEARKSSHLRMTARDNGAHPELHLRTLSVPPSIVASK